MMHTLVNCIHSVIVSHIFIVIPSCDLMICIVTNKLKTVIDTYNCIDIEYI